MVEISSLTKLSSTLKNLNFIFSEAEYAQAETQRKRVVHKLENHVLPRLRNLNAPLVCVLAGSTGSGKSTLVNSILSAQVAATSPVRPTTRRPLLIHAEADTHWFTGKTILPQLAKVQVAADAPPTPVNVGNHSEIEVRPTKKLPTGLAILDAPDFDSISAQNRQLSRQLLDIADMWIFVTTANRYADALPWEFLKEAQARNITITVVLNRTPAAAAAEIRLDLERLLAEAGITRAPLIVVEEMKLTNGLIPTGKITELTQWLLNHAADSQLRIATVMRTLLGTSHQLLAETELVKTILEQQYLVVADALTAVDTQGRQALTRVTKLSADGTLLKGEVLARWQEIVGVSEFSQMLERGFGLLKFRFKSILTGRKPQLNTLENALESGLQTIIAAELVAAETRIRATWNEHPQMRLIEAQIPALDLAEIETGAKNITLRWQHELLEMIRSEGGAKKTTARVLAAGVNLLGIALMIVIFASTGGLTGAEVGIAGTTSVVAQKLLEIVFGEQAVKNMTVKAQDLLRKQVSEFYTAELDKIQKAVPQVSDTIELSAVLNQANQTLQELEREVRLRLGGSI